MAATLQNLVQNNSQLLTRGPGGVLQTTTGDEVQSLASKAGVAPPITPLGGAMLGANPDQQKMLGTPTQKAAAITIANQPQQIGQSTDLATTLATQQASTQQNTTQQAATQKSQQLAGLGDIGTKVNDFIDTERGKLETAGQQATQGNGVAVQAADNLTDKSGTPITGDNLVTLKNALSAYRTNPSDMNTLLTINQMLGRDVNSTLNPTEVDNLYQSSVSAIAAGGGSAIDNNLTAQDLINQGNFGYNINQLSTLLEVPPAQLANYTVAQIRDQMNTVAQKEFSTTQQLQQTASSNTTGAAEQGAAQQQLRALSANGTRSVENDVQNLQQSVANADNVQFGGQTYAVEDLLKSNTISGLITNYLNAPAGDPTRTQLESTEPQLVDFINDNQQLLQNISNQQKLGATAFTTLQNTNQAIGQVAGAAFDPTVLKGIIPDYGQLSSKAYNPTDYALISTAQSMAPADANALVGNVNSFVSQNPEIVSQLGNLSTAEVKNFNNTQDLQAYNTNKANMANLNSIDPSNDQAVYNALFGTTVDPNQVQTSYDESQARQALGFASNQVSALNGSNGQIASGQALLNAMKAQNPTATLAQALDGKTQSMQTLDISNLINQPSLTDLQQGILTKMAPNIVNGQVTAATIANSGLTEDQMYGAMDNGMLNAWGADATTAVKTTLQTDATNRANSIVSSVPTNYMSDSDFNNLVAANSTATNFGYGVSANIPNVPAIQTAVTDKVNQVQAQIDSLNSQVSQYGREIDTNVVDNTINQLKAEQTRLGGLVTQAQTQANQMKATAQQQAITAGSGIGVGTAQQAVTGSDGLGGKITNAANTVGNILSGGIGGGGGGGIFSDKRTKKDISKISSADIDEFLNALSPKSYKYKGSDEPKVGFIMQDIDKTKLGKLISRNKDGMKAYDPQSLQGVLLASVKRLNEKSDA